MTFMVQKQNPKQLYNAAVFICNNDVKNLIFINVTSMFVLTFQRIIGKPRQSLYQLNLFLIKIPLLDLLPNHFQCMWLYCSNIIIKLNEKKTCF